MIHTDALHQTWQILVIPGFFSSRGISGCGMAGQDRTWWFLNRMFLKNDMPGFSPSVSPEPKWFPNVKKIRKIGVVFSCFYTNLPGLTNFGDTMAPNLWRLRRSQQMIRFHQSKLLMPAPQLVISISCAQKNCHLVWGQCFTKWQNQPNRGQNLVKINPWKFWRRSGTWKTSVRKRLE